MSDIAKSQIAVLPVRSHHGRAPPVAGRERSILQPQQNNSDKQNKISAYECASIEVSTESWGCDRADADKENKEREYGGCGISENGLR